MRTLSFCIPFTLAALTGLSIAACSSQDSSVGDGGNNLGTSMAAGGQSGQGGGSAQGGKGGTGPSAGGQGGTTSPAAGHGGSVSPAGQGGAAAGGAGGTTSSAGGHAGNPQAGQGGTSPAGGQGGSAAACSSDKDCGTGQSCVSGSCQPGVCFGNGKATVSCGGVCVDTQSDAKNCGSCGSVCPTGAVCAAGACTAGGTGGAGGSSGACTTDKDCGCASACIAGKCEGLGGIPPTCSTDADCGPACLGLTCASGACQQKGAGGAGGGGAAGGAGGAGGCTTSPDGGVLVDCGGACVDTQGDPNNCGSCGSVCAAGQACEQGVCTAGGTGGSAGSGNTCTVNSDCGCGCACVNGTCGDCTGAIPPSCNADADCGPACANLVCVANTCQKKMIDCGTGKVNCGGTCIDTTSDPANCGGCGVACAADQLCSAGVCSAGSCPMGTINCSGACIDITSSASNCGACGNACPAGSLCTQGVCASGSGGAGGGSGGPSACKSNADCTQSQSCKSSECLDPVAGVPTPCSCSSDCTALGEDVCVSGTCAPLTGNRFTPQQPLPISAPGCDPTNPACKPVYAQFTVGASQTISSVELYIDATVPAGAFLGMELAHVEAGGTQVTLADIKYPAGLCSNSSWVGSFPRTITPTDGFGTGQDQLGVFVGSDAKGTWLLKIHNNSSSAPAVVIHDVALFIH